MGLRIFYTGRGETSDESRAYRRGGAATNLRGGPSKSMVRLGHYTKELRRKGKLRKRALVPIYNREEFRPLRSRGERKGDRTVGPHSTDLGGSFQVQGGE